MKLIRLNQIEHTCAHMHACANINKFTWTYVISEWVLILRPISTYVSILRLWYILIRQNSYFAVERVKDKCSLVVAYSTDENIVVIFLNTVDVNILSKAIS